MVHRRRSAHFWGNSGYRNHPDDSSSGVVGPTTARDLIDPEDPAYPYILRAAHQLTQFGFDTTEPDIVRRAIEVGTENYNRDPAVTNARAIVAAATRRADPFALREGEVVYYMRIGNRVKIGTSSNLPYRLAAINPEELMVTEPGNRLLEKVRHEQFAELRTHGEWFRFDDRLVAHIEELRGLDTPTGDPELTNPERF